MRPRFLKRWLLSLRRSGWSPTTVSGLQLWLDAKDTDTVTVNEAPDPDQVSAVTDLSGLGNAFDQSTEAEQTIWRRTGWTPDGGPCWEHLADADFLRRASDTDLVVTDHSWVVAMAVYHPTPSTFAVWWGDGDGSTADQGIRCFLTSARAFAIYHSNDATGPITGSATALTVPDDIFTVLLWGVDGSTGEMLAARLGATLERKAITTGHPHPNSGLLDHTISGGHFGGSHSLTYQPNGLIRELCMWRRASSKSFSDSEVYSIVAGLAARNGL